MLSPIDLASAIQLMRAGDVLAFSGNAFGSKLIQFFTKSPISHVAIVSENGGGKEYVEANNILKKVGVYRFPAEKLEEYNGRVWLLPLSSSAHKRMNKTILENYLFQQANFAFDTFGSIRSAEVLLPLIPVLRNRIRIVYQEDLSKLFCSEFIAAAFRTSGVIKNINASEVTPADLCRFSIYEASYFQILGSHLEIPDFNMTSPELFGLK